MLSNTARFVLVVILIFAVVAAIVLALGLRAVRTNTASTRITSTIFFGKETWVKPATEQWVVWDSTVKDAPAHYINRSDGGALDIATTACGQQVSGGQFGTIEQMMLEKRMPCAECKKALQAFAHADYLYTNRSSAGPGPYDQRLAQVKSKKNK